MSKKNDSDPQTGGILGEVQNIKTNGVASLAELREFVGSLKGRNPQEILGEVAGNGLVQGTVISAIGFLVVLLIFTAIPYLMTGKETENQKENEAKKTTTSQQPAQLAGNEARQEPEPAAKGPEGKTGDEVIDKLGIGETQKADPEENPLGDKFNDLLEGVK